VRIVSRVVPSTLAKMPALDLQGLFSDVQRAGLSSRSAHHTHLVSHRALGQTVRWDRMPRTPRDDDTLPNPNG